MRRRKRSFRNCWIAIRASSGQRKHPVHESRCGFRTRLALAKRTVWSPLQNVEVGLQVLRADRSDDCRVQVRVRESEAENELHRGHAIEQVIEMCPAPAFPLQPGLLSLGWRSLCRAAANDDACALLTCSGDRSFVLTLNRRVRDLKYVEREPRLPLGAGAGSISQFIH